MKHALKVFLVLVAAWAIDQPTPRAEGVAFPVDRHTADTVGTEDAKVPQSGIPLLHRDFEVPMLQRQDNNILTQQREDAKKGLLLPGESPKGRSAKDFVTPDGRFDLEAIRASGYQGPLDLKGLNVGTDPHTGEPVLSPSAITKRVEGKGTLDQQVGLDVGIEPRTGEPVLSPMANTEISRDPDDTFWTPLGSGMNYYVYALAVYDDTLIAGGGFTTAGGGGVSANRIASWDGSSWDSLGSGMDTTVLALTVYDNKLIVGGQFTTAGGVSANCIASWDGSSWSPLGSGMNNHVFALAVYDNKLIAGGEFSTAGGVNANNIASWNGSSWSVLGSGMNNAVCALAVYDNKLIAGGYFWAAGGVYANYIASWDGSSWDSLGSGMCSEDPDPHHVDALTVYDNKLIAGGYFITAGGVSANYIASWDGFFWSPLGSGMSWYVRALTVYDNKLIAGGAFWTAGGVVTHCIASWDGFSWSPLGSGMGGATTTPSSAPLRSMRTS